MYTNGSTCNSSIGPADRAIGDVAIECETLNPYGNFKEEDHSEKSLAPATMKAFVEVAKVIPKTNTRGRKPKEYEQYCQMAREKLVEI